MSLQLHLFLWPEEVLLLQFAKDSTLGLQGQMGGRGLFKGQEPVHRGTKNQSTVEPGTGPLWKQEPRTNPLWDQEMVHQGTRKQEQIHCGTR